MTDTSQEALQLSLGMGTAHQNHYLFSDHFLDKLLLDDARWQAALDDAETFLTWIQNLYTKEREQLPHYKESQLEEHWFKPILGQMGHIFEGQASVPGLDADIKVPDFVFFIDEEGRQAAVTAQRTEEYAAKALALGEVKSWEVPLGKKVKDGGPSFDKQNPSFQIDYYLKATGLDWGILSNGRRWRLVHKDSSQRLNIFYEVDLTDLLQRGKPEDMRYFILFFHQAAFRAGPEGHVFLDDVLRASKAYAVELEEDLQENVYKALERLMQGFLDIRRNKLGAADLPQIYQNSLYLLYRLLFIFYAESRELLPVEGDAEYREHYSLHDLKHEIARDNVPTKTGTAVSWGNLLTLFAIINGDDIELNRSLGVPRYNGGLFNPELHPFLAQKAVGDRALVDAIDLLARRTTEGGKEFVDYRTLGERQLGSIYEGLLEYQPRYAEEAMVAIQDKKGECWIAEAEAPKKARVVARCAVGQIYLATDSGERKATGSYYTPDFIVQYIVENTLGPLVEKATERVRARAKGVKSRVEKEKAAQSLADEILSLKVLDPAMGSGHFLVASTEFLAVALATDPYVQTEVTPEEDVTYWKRRVVERCIYGVDKNPLAVELAKLSLWLATVAVDRPLSFLDHHLKCGDSLVGARVGDLGWAPPTVLSKKAQKQFEQQKAGQMNLFEYRLSQQLPAVMGKVLEIEGQESDSYESVQAKEAADEAVGQLKAPFEAVANLWVSAYFGHEISLAEYGEALDAIGNTRLWEMPAVQKAKKMAGELCFFHWELAFPEVFYDKNGQPRGDAAGFDAVGGNPPYLRQETLERELKKFLESQFNNVYHGAADIYVYFLGLGFRLLAHSGLLGVITSGVFRKLNYGSPLREALANQFTLRTIVDFGVDQVFEGAITYPIIIITENRLPSANDKVLVIDDVTGLRSRISSIQQNYCDLPVANEQWNFINTGLRRIIKGWEGATILINYLTNSIHRGVTTGLNEAFVISGEQRKGIVSEDQNADHLIKSYIRGEDLHAWFQDDPGLYLVFTRRGTNIENFPGVKHYLESFRERLEPQPPNWDQSKTWFGRKPGSYKWYEIQDSVDYYEIFERPRIHSSKVSLRPSFSLRMTPTLAANTSYVLPIDEPELGCFLLSILNSRVSEFYCRTVFAPKANGYYEVQPDQLEQFPMPDISFSTPAGERKHLLAKGQELYDRFCKKDDLACVTSFVEHELDQRHSDVVYDLLAFLAQQMIKKNKDKQQVTEDFWLDLEGAADPGAFDTLRNKGKWESSLWKEPVCRPYVDEKSRSTRYLDSSLGWSEVAFKAFVKALAGSVSNLSNLVRVYRKYQPHYHELLGQITRTDYLIDQIVYSLYGLTEEEISIVEGTK